MAAAAAASLSASIIHRFTYQLGRSIYVPLTSRCNSIPLPVTRGPGFVLNSDVVDVLRNVRFVENSPRGGSDASIRDGSMNGTGVSKVVFPEYDLPLVTSLYNNEDNGIGSTFSSAAAATSNSDNDNNSNIKNTKENMHIQEDSIQPSIATLVDQVSSHLEDNLDLHEVCIAGEGEPTLRMDALLAIARTVQSFNQQQQRRNDQQSAKQINVRLITNGLCYSIPHLGYSNNNDPNKIQLPKLRYTILRDLIDAGVSRLSVALNTANRHEYDVLMQPACYTGGGMILTDDDDGNSGGNNNTTNNANTVASSSPPMMMPGTAHDLICEFIMDATKLGMDVEITGVDRPDIDKLETERLARLLLSVAPKNKKGRVGRRSVVRWRPYFE
mmetsp:Transcript_9364/g.14311  ORF Transcript_9364/g.14311 Transcript_9364/m.14311 type:complete len:385 (+) Transcript_9364:134-1288(+)